MLFWTFVIIIIAGFVLFTFDWENLGITISVIGIFGIIASVVVLAINYIGIDGYIARMNTRYETLVYQYENDIYDNDNDLGKKELYSEITEYNCDVAEGKIMQDNIWVYNLYSDVYDELELIEFPEE